jgi:AcrR family transcriptional regulator
VSERPYHHGSLERALTEAAMEVVAVDGIGALSLRDIARTIGVSPSATYRHFPSRDHLVAHVSQIAREDLARALILARGLVPATGSRRRRSIRRFEAIGRAYVLFAVDAPNMFEAAFTPCDVRPATDDDPQAWAVLVEAVDEMVSTGAIPATRRQDAPIIAWSGVHGLATILTASIWPTGYTFDDEVDAVISGISRAIA